MKAFVTSRENPVSFLNEIKSRITELGKKEEGILIRFIPKSADSKYFSRLVQVAREAREEAKQERVPTRPRYFIIALKPSEAILDLDDKVERVEIYEEKDLLETNQEGIYEIPPNGSSYWFCRLYKKIEDESRNKKRKT